MASQETCSQEQEGAAGRAVPFWAIAPWPDWIWPPVGMAQAVPPRDRASRMPAVRLFFHFLLYLEWLSISVLFIVSLT